MNYRFTQEAREEFDWAADWYEARRRGLGDEFVSELHATLQRIVFLPHSFARIASVPRGREIRFLTIDRFDYFLVYEVTSTEVVVLGVSHSKSQLRKWWKRNP